MKYNKVKEALEKQDRSQSWLAKKINISTNAMSSICQNKSQPKLVTLYKIAAALKIPVCELLMEENPEVMVNG